LDSQITQRKKMAKVVVGMSGGVDSSVSLLLLKEQGYEPIGVSLKYDIWRDSCNDCEENVCCSKKSFAIAKNVCKQLGVDHYIVDVATQFKKEVIDYFISELKNGRTPSPCVFCNPKVKFKNLLDFADKHGCQYIATGHYARVNYANKNEGSRIGGKAELLKAVDEKKDQTYSLSFLTQKELSRIIFPLGEMTKGQVYEIANKQKGFEIFEKQKQSQDFCFISGKSLPRFLEKEIGVSEGFVKNTNDKVVGIHKGLHFYTIGQRKGIGIGGVPREARGAKWGPYYVVEKDINTNDLIVSQNRSNFSKKEIMLKPFNIISGDNLAVPVMVMAKLRSGAKENKAIISQVGDELILEFKHSQDSVTPGQVAVFYKGDHCLGAGVIN